MIEGAAAIGQYIGFSLAAYFADLSDPERFSERVRLQGAPRPGAYSGRIEELGPHALWEMENNTETRTTDPRGMSVKERIDAAVDEVSAYLESVLDVRPTDTTSRSTIIHSAMTRTSCSSTASCPFQVWRLLAGRDHSRSAGNRSLKLKI